MTGIRRRHGRHNAPPRSFRPRAAVAGDVLAGQVRPDRLAVMPQVPGDRRHRSPLAAPPRPRPRPSRCRPRRRTRRRHRPDVGPRRPPRLRPPPARTARVNRSTSATRPMRQRGKGKTGTWPCGHRVPDAGRTVLRGTAPAAQGGLPVVPWTRTLAPGFLPGRDGRAGCPCSGVLGDVGLGVFGLAG